MISATPPEPAAARLSGIPVGRRIFGAFVVSGALAGLAGVLYAARFGTLDANARPGASANADVNAGGANAQADASAKPQATPNMQQLTIVSFRPMEGECK